MHRLLSLLAACSLPALLGSQTLQQRPVVQSPPPLRIAIAGLVHGHVAGFLLKPAQTRSDITIAGIFEPDIVLAESYAREFNIPKTLLFTNLAAMLDRVKPDALAVFTNTFDHAQVVEAAAPRHIPVMMEKPLAVNVEQARRMQLLAAQYDIPVVVNYETSWYASHAALWKLVKEQKAAGDIRRMVAMDGHQGPKEIGVRPEFLAFLLDPHLNGAGALFDFGCYGANLMTWLMDNQRPVAVRATTQQIKPEIYRKVDDEATVLLEYAKAQGVIEASWNWPFARKDLEVYGQTGYAIATGGDSLRVRLANEKERAATPGPMPADERDALSYFVAVVRERRKVTGLSSLENNVVVTEILDAARESARTGQRVVLR